MRLLYPLFYLSTILVSAPPQQNGAIRPTLLIISSRSQSKYSKLSPLKKGTYLLDLSVYIDRAVRAAGSAVPIIYSSDSPVIKQALSSGKLATSDLVEPITTMAAERIGHIMGVSGVVIANAKYANAQVDASYELLLPVGQQDWRTAFYTHFSSPKDNNKHTLLSNIHLAVNSLMDQLTQQPLIPVQSQTMPPAPTATAQTPRPPKPAPQNSAGLSAAEILIDNFRRTGDIPNMIESLRQAIDENPFQADLRSQLIKAYEKRGLNDLALGEAARATMLMPKDAKLQKLLGDCYAAVGNSDNAESAYEQGIKLDPRSASCCVALGDLQLKQGDESSALQTYHQAIVADPNSPLPHERLAKLDALNGDYPDCLKEMTRSRSLLPPGSVDQYRSLSIEVMKAVVEDVKGALNKLAAMEGGFEEGTITRETYYDTVRSNKNRLTAISDLIDKMPTVQELSSAQNHLNQAVSLAAQACDGLLDYLASPNSSSLSDTNMLLRAEAAGGLDKTLSELSLPSHTAVSASP
ncbi:MAG: tetratricopeptide repeat protein [Armatimonadetes bacterium]|nr:tetratricopeptide repeat protein [Armatimonadota bacterium]